MNEKPVYGGLTQDQLDREYDNRAKVERAAEHIAWYTARSAEARAGLDGVLDIAYGRSEAETLDLFGAGQEGSRPVWVFFHGGYWRSLHKDDFSYVAGALVPNGALCAVVNYALIPQVDMGELVAQCRRSMVWLYRNVHRYGGDPNRLFATGHSAGGHLVAMMMATDWPTLFPDCPSGLVRGGLAVSGLFDLEPIRLSFLNESLSLDAQSVAANSPVHLKKRNRGPLRLVYGSLEGEEYSRQSKTLAEAWPETDVEAMDGHDHFSIMREMDRPNGALARMAVEVTESVSPA